MKFQGIFANINDALYENEDDIVFDEEAMGVHESSGHIMKVIDVKVKSLTFEELKDNISKLKEIRKYLSENRGFAFDKTLAKKEFGRFVWADERKRLRQLVRSLFGVQQVVKTQPHHKKTEPAIHVIREMLEEGLEEFLKHFPAKAAFKLDGYVSRSFAKDVINVLPPEMFEVPNVAETNKKLRKLIKIYLVDKYETALEYKIERLIKKRKQILKSM